MNNKWKDIWDKRTDVAKGTDKKELFLAFKKMDGFDVIDGGLSFESFENQISELVANLTFMWKNGGRKIQSIYEVGCGCGANLYYFLYHLNDKDKEKIDIKRIGGSDYSNALIEVAHKYLPDDFVEELETGEAVDIHTDKKYDTVFANSVFSYFPNYEYAESVLKKC